MVNGTGFALEQLCFSPTLLVHTNRDTTKPRGRISIILEDFTRGRSPTAVHRPGASAQYSTSDPHAEKGALPLDEKGKR
jgi:hypothetical protein